MVPQLLACAQCRNQLRAGSLFCDQCGTPVSAVRPRAAPSLPALPVALERKQITVLFADITRFTELVADRDPEDARHWVDRILGRMVEAVRFYDGTVHQVMGDAIMALFGAPVAYEDHALRACYAALRMQDSISKYAEELRRTEGFPLQIRVGLNSGEVAAGARDVDPTTAYSVNGQAVNLAARMEQIAVPGTILMAPQTYRLTEGFLETRSLGPTAIKGLAQPIETYELLRAGTARSRIQVAAARGLTRFIGRGGELSALRRASENAYAGRGQIVAVVGEPGVGKSRLIFEFVHAECPTGWRILETGATSVSCGTGTNARPMADFLRGLFRIAQAEDAAQILERVTTRLLSLDSTLLPVLPTLLALMDVPYDEAQFSDDEAPQPRRGALELVTRLLACEGERQPLLVVFEDLHAVDADTQALLSGLVNSLPEARILFVVSYRPEYKPGWGAQSHCTQLHLEPFDDQRAHELLDALAGNASILGPLKELLIARTAGNPFFLEESIRALVENGVLQGAAGRYSIVKPISELNVPATVEALLASRIDRLDPRDKRLLLCAAALGYHVPVDVLEAVAETSSEDLRSALERLEESGYLRKTILFPSIEYTFRHALVYDVAYRNLSLERRRTLHAEALAAAERIYADRIPDKADWLAFHAFRGQVWESSVRYSRMAASRAVRRAAGRTAVEHLENALASAACLSGEGKETLEVDLRIELRHALTPLGHVQRTLDTLATAERIAVRMDDRARLGRIVSFTANCLLIRARHAEALATGARALEIARQLSNEPLAIATRIYMARARLARAECGQAAALLRETIEALDRKSDDDFLGMPVLPGTYSRSILAAVLAESGQFAEAVAQASEATRRAVATRQPDSIMWANWSRGLVELYRGSAADAVQIFERLRDLCRAHDLDAYTSRAMAGLGCAKVRAGLLKDGLRSLRQAVDMDAFAEPLTTRSFALNGLAEGLYLARSDEAALEVSTQALAFAREHGERGAEAYASLLGGLIRVRRNADLEAAEDCLGCAESIAAPSGLLPLLGHCHLARAGLHRLRDELDKARDYRERGAGVLRALGMELWFPIEEN
jgi:class 3 adenylate cyclase